MISSISTRLGLQHRIGGFRVEIGGKLKKLDKKAGCCKTFLSDKSKRRSVLL